MKNNGSLLYGLCLVVGDMLALIAAFVGAYILRVSIDHRPIAQSVHASTYLHIFFVLLPFWILTFALLGLYSNSIYEKRFSEAGRLFIGSFIGMMFVSGYAYFDNNPVFPAKLVPVYGFLLAFILLLLIRNFLRWLRIKLFSRNIGITHILIVGDTKISAELASALSDTHSSGYKIVGIVSDKEHSAQRFPSLRVFDSFEEAVAKLKPDDIHSIVQTELYASGERNNQVLEFAQTHHIAYRFIPGNTELFVGNIEVELFQSSVPVIAVHQTALIGWGRVIKRSFDFLVALAMLIVLSPILILVALLIMFTDPGTPFFKHERVTRFNNKFKAYKFRTMKRKYSGKDDVWGLKDLGRDDLADMFQKGQKLPEDPRVSLIGRFLRRFSLDELPQLINVIKGDISLVGPRAVVAEELKFYEKKSPMLLSVKTGITGLAQVSGRSNLDYYERAKLDLYYVQNWSFWMDVMILIKTIKVVFQRSGAR